MRELSVAEQRYLAVLAVISEGRTVTQVAGRWGVSGQSMHAWLARYEARGLAGLTATTHKELASAGKTGTTIAAGKRGLWFEPIRGNGSDGTGGGTRRRPAL